MLLLGYEIRIASSPVIPAYGGLIADITLVSGPREVTPPVDMAVMQRRNFQSFAPNQTEVSSGTDRGEAYKTSCVRKTTQL
jgi:hypothetical protein